MQEPWQAAPLSQQLALSLWLSRTRKVGDVALLASRQLGWLQLPGFRGRHERPGSETRDLLQHLGWSTVPSWVEHVQRVWSHSKNLS